jgi:hypothetical protein
MRNLEIAKANFASALRSFDSKATEMKLQKPVSMQKLQALFERTELQGQPSFTMKGRTISVSDPSSFDYAVLGESIKSFCVGLDQLLVGFDLEKLNHHAFETFAWYSSAFQFVDCIMSLRGVHYVQRPLTIPLVRTTSKKVFSSPKPKDLLEVVERHFEFPFIRGETRGARWSFDRASVSHEARWNDFGRLLISMIKNGESERIPPDIRRMYGYLKMISDYKAHMLDWRLFTVEFKSDGQFMSAISAHGKDLANMRHRAVYQSQTYDVFSYAMLRQGRIVDDFANSGRKFMKSFAVSVAKWSVEMLADVWSSLKNLKPSPQRGLDWSDVACRYIPLRIALTELRLEKIHTKREIASISGAIPNLVVEILSNKHKGFWKIREHAIDLS